MRWSAPGLVGAVVLAVAATGCSSHATHRASPTTTTTTTRSAVPLTAQQMDAHLGVGVPAGWVPVDGGDARLWVPPDSNTHQDGKCVFAPPAEPPVVTVGSVAPPDCQAQVGGYMHPLPPLMAEVSIISETEASTIRPSLTVHGYRLYRRAAARHRGWAFYEVPQLHVQIATHGKLAARILATLAPSARYVALDTAYETVSQASRRLTRGGVAVSIPTSWPIAIPEEYGCGTVAKPDLTIIEPPKPIVTGSIGPVGGGTCMPPNPPYPSSTGMAPVDRLTLYLPAANPGNQWDVSNNTDAFSARGQPVTTLHFGDTTITVWAPDGFFNALELFARRDGSSVLHSMTLELGRDGRVGAGVLASIRAVS